MFWAFGLNLYLQLAIYLAIIGGRTRFRAGISSRAQRGWFMSWAILGIVYGNMSLFEDDDDDDDDDIWLAFSPAGPRPFKKITVYQKVLATVFPMMTGAATIGGVVAMVQQYTQFVEC